MYNPIDGKKAYLSLIKEKGALAGFQSAVFVISWYFFNKYILQSPVPLPTLIIGFFVFCAYFTWKSKLVRFLRGHLRGQEFRDRAE